MLGTVLKYALDFVAIGVPFDIAVWFLILAVLD